MKRKVICIVSTVIAFILATAFNLANMIGGAGTSVFGVILSVVFCVCIFVLPVAAKNRAFAAVSAGFAVFAAIASTVGLLLFKDILPDSAGIAAALPLTAFYGLMYFLRDYGIFYPALIAVMLIDAVNLILAARRFSAAKAE